MEPSFIIVLGNIGDALTFIGPFSKFEDAEVSPDFLNAGPASAVIVKLVPCGGAFSARPLTEHEEAELDQSPFL